MRRTLTPLVVTLACGCGFPEVAFTLDDAGSGNLAPDAAMVAVGEEASPEPAASDGSAPAIDNNAPTGNGATPAPAVATGAADAIAPVDAAADLGSATRDSGPLATGDSTASVPTSAPIGAGEPNAPDASGSSSADDSGASSSAGRSGAPSSAGTSGGSSSASSSKCDGKGDGKGNGNGSANGKCASTGG